jgi:cob(I)alamin adenosyltransferase
MGDKGKTNLGDMRIVSKDDPRVEALGCVDELISYLGVAASVSQSERTIHLIESIQHTLSVVAADIATPLNKEGKRIAEEDVNRISSLIDTIESELPPLNRFILPGGALPASHLHVARAVARRAERKVVHAMKRYKLNPLVVVYLNRVSDLLFLLARKTNIEMQGRERFMDE